jgi:Cu(I)/Ag(I) efflux system periplasmic protein CusF
MNITSRVLAICLLVAIPLTTGFAQQPAAIASTVNDEMTAGEIRKVDKDSKKITIKHGEIKSLDMPAMTMVFQVKDVTILDKVNQGDKVKFKVIKADGGLVVTDLQVVK